LPTRIAIGSGVSSFSIGVILGIFEVQGWKMPSPVAIALLGLASLSAVVAIGIVLHGAWVISSPHRQGWRLRLPFYNVNTPGNLTEPTPIQKEHERLASIYRTFLSDESEKLCNHGIHICKAVIDFSGLNVDDEPFIDFNLSILAVSVYTVQIGNEISGRVNYGNNPLMQYPTVETKIANLRHSEQRTLKVRQPLSERTARSVYSQRGKEIKFNISAVRVLVETSTLDGQAGPTCQLSIGTTIKGVVPDDIPHKGWMGVRTGGF
jgi:hypothetical protein